LDGTHQLLGEDTHSVLQYTTDALVHASEKDGLGNWKKSNYMLIYRPQNAEQNYDIKLITKFFENMEKLRHLVTTVSNQILIRET
jgi:hypothetical protein